MIFSQIFITFIFQFIVQLRSSFSTSSRSSSPQNISPKFNELQSFPHLNILLRFDALQFFNVISTCADAPVFAKCEGIKCYIFNHQLRNVALHIIYSRLFIIIGPLQEGTGISATNPKFR